MVQLYRFEVLLPSPLQLLVIIVDILRIGLVPVIGIKYVSCAIFQPRPIPSLLRLTLLMLQLVITRWQRGRLLPFQRLDELIDILGLCGLVL